MHRRSTVRSTSLRDSQGSLLRSRYFRRKLHRKDRYTPRQVRIAGESESERQPRAATCSARRRSEVEGFVKSGTRRSSFCPESQSRFHLETLELDLASRRRDAHEEKRPLWYGFDIHRNNAFHLLSGKVAGMDPRVVRVD